MFNTYQSYLNSEAARALRQIRECRAQGNIKLAIEWGDYYWRVDQERKAVRQMTVAEFVSYWFGVIVPLQTAL